jgi:pimeloyl-ACP methyl ester carboxylesterase
MGAGIAATVVAARPDLVGGAVLEDPPWFIRSPGEDRPPEQETLHQWTQQFRDDLDGSVARGRAEQPRWPEIELAPWGLSKAQLDPSLTDVEQILGLAPWIDHAAAIARPTLLVTGDRQDAVIVTTASRERLAELGNRHIEVAVVPGAGHTVRRDDADAYHQIVDPWIKAQFRGAAAS